MTKFVEQTVESVRIYGKKSPFPQTVESVRLYQKKALFTQTRQSAPRCWVFFHKL